MKKLLLIVFLFSSLVGSAQNLSRQELTPDEVLYLAKDIFVPLEPKQKDFDNSLKNLLTTYEFEIQYNNKPIYRGAIYKPSIIGPGSPIDRSYASFCLDYSMFDTETKLELSESNKFTLSEVENGKKYFWTDNYLIFQVDPFTKNIKVNDKLAEKLRIKFYKTTL